MHSNDNRIADPYSTPAETAPGAKRGILRSPVTWIVGFGLACVLTAAALTMLFSDSPQVKKLDEFPRHRGGAHVLMESGEVKFLTEPVNSEQNESKCGLWGKLGARTDAKSTPQKD